MNALRIILLMCCALASFQSMTTPPSASCTGTVNCGNSQWVDCEISIPPLGKCKIEYLSNGVRCIALDSDWKTVGTRTALCEDDSGSGAGCDPGDPLYWLYCDPFAF